MLESPPSPGGRGGGGLSSQRSVMSMMMIPLFQNLSGLAQQYRGILPSLSKHPGAAPGVNY